MADYDVNISKEQLEFSVFCIESVSEKLNINGSDTYKLLTEKSRILDDYIMANFDVLHTLSKEYIVDDIVMLMRDGGLLV